MAETTFENDRKLNKLERSLKEQVELLRSQYLEQI